MKTVIGVFFCVQAMACFVAGCGQVSFVQHSSVQLEEEAATPGDSSARPVGAADSEQSVARGQEGLENGATDQLNLEIKCAESLPPRSLAQDPLAMATEQPHAATERAERGALTLNIRQQCEWSETVTFAPLQNLTVWLLLDVSGSMRPSIDRVREGVATLFELYQKKGWQLEVGAIAFTDSIDAIIPPTHNVAAALESIASDQGAWHVAPGRGGDTPELGLAALGCMLAMAHLGRQDCTAAELAAAESGTLRRLLERPQSVFDSQWIIYVSDAPARNSAFEFASRKLGHSMSELADLVRKSGAEMRFYAATKKDRTGLLPNWPTPFEQLQELGKIANVPFEGIHFPVAAESVEKTFVAQARRQPSATRQQQCRLEEVGLLSGAGQLVHVSRPSEASTTDGSIQVRFAGTSKDEPESAGQEPAAEEFPSEFYIQRLCSASGMRTFERIKLPL